MVNMYNVKNDRVLKIMNSVCCGGWWLKRLVIVGIVFWLCDELW